MKKLTRDERRGVVALVIVAIIALTILFCVRAGIFSSGRSSAEPQLIYVEKDTLSQGAEASVKSIGKKKKATDKKEKKKKKAAKSSPARQPSSPRDILADTIPTY